jgi:aminopeptidase N
MTHDAKHVALANGTFISSKDNPNGTKTTRYKLDFRCPSYLVCFAIGEFIEVDDGYVDEMPIKYFAPKGTDPADLRRAFDKTPAMVKWISKKLNVKFPWTKYYQFVAQHIRGAMENISLVSWSPMFVMDETWASERKMVTDTVNIHEMAHTYFGDSVVIKHFEVNHLLFVFLRHLGL